jgi:hypothetical protein
MVSSRKILIVLVAVAVVVAAFSIFMFIPQNTVGNTESSTSTAQSTSITSSSTSIVTSISTSTTIMPPLTGQTTVVNKQIPPGYVMGDTIDVKLISGMSVLYIKQPNEKISIRFTAQNSGDAQALTVYVLASKNQSSINVGLQEDVNGSPSGKWIDDTGFGTTQIPHQNGFVTVNLQKPISISQGKTYHVVVEPAEPHFSESISIYAYQANPKAQPYNVADPDVVWTDNTMNILLFNGGNWVDQNLGPIFAVSYSDGTREGQPYSLSAPWVIHDSIYVGQRIVPASNYKIGKIAFDLGLKNQPTDKLYYEIIDSNNQVLSQGVFAEPSQLTIWQTWIEVTLPTPVDLQAGNLYRIALYSPQTNLDNAYLLYGHEFTYDAAIGYGGLQHQLVTSQNAGQNWADWTDADAIFKLTTVP